MTVPSGRWTSLASFLQSRGLLIPFHPITLISHTRPSFHLFSTLNRSYYYVSHLLQASTDAIRENLTLVPNASPSGRSYDPTNSALVQSLSSHMYIFDSAR